VSKVFSFRRYAKHVAAKAGFRVVNARRRWGVNVLDDVGRVLCSKDVRCVFDVGANFGQTSLSFAKAFPNARIHAFEPVTSTFEKLVANIRDDIQIRAWRLALGDAPGESEITLYGDPGKSSLFSDLRGAHRGSPARRETINVSTVDAFMNEHRIGILDLLKIDTEGFDLRVLEGSAAHLDNGAISLVYCEFHHFFPPPCAKGDQLGNLSSIYSFLTERGYRLLTIYTDGVHTDEPLGSYNALFMSPCISATW
jgi:FkbM family methyltransferase